MSVLQARAALVVAHPSHELLVHGWLQLNRPQVFVLTDGSGRSGSSRLSQTTRLLEQVGARRGSIYGRLTDLEAYATILKHDVSYITSLVEELSEEFVSERIDYVVGDAAEGYNTVHDICRIIIGAAVELAARRHGRRIKNFDFAVVGPPAHCPIELHDEAIWVHLDQKAFAAKVAAARAYSPKLNDDIEAALGGGPFQGIKRFAQPQMFGEVDPELSVMTQGILGAPALQAELRGVTDGFTLNDFHVECLRPVSNREGAVRQGTEPRFYELYGAKLVAAGRYSQAIRFREHMLPVAEAIWKGIRKNGNDPTTHPDN